MGGILKRAGGVSAGLGLILGAAGTFVVAICFAVYAWLRDPLTPAGASAVTALAAAVLMGIGAVVLLRAGKSGPAAHKDKHARDHQDDRGGAQNLAERALDLARDKPIIAAAAALATGLLALRNPTLIGAVIGAVTARANRPKR